MTRRISLKVMAAALLVTVLSFLFISPQSAVAQVIEPMSLNITLDKTSVAIGGQISATVTVTGGRQPYGIVYFWSISSAGTDISSNVSNMTNGATVSYTPTIGEKLHLFAQATDADGREKYGSSQDADITGAETVTPMSLNITLDKTSVAIGGQINATVNVTGGRQPYGIVYFWSISSAGADISSNVSNMTNGATVSYTPTIGEKLHLFAQATDADGREKYGSSQDVVIMPAPKITGVALDLYSTILNAGESCQLIPSISPANAGDKSLTWSSSDPSVATVDARGLVNTLTPGTTTITTTAQDGSGMSAACRIIVQASATEGLPGDANNDTSIDIMDLVSIIDFIVSNASPASPANADANGDGTVDILDLVWVIDRIVGS